MVLLSQNLPASGGKKDILFHAIFLKIVFFWNVSFHNSDQGKMTTENGRRGYCGTLF